MKYRFIALFLMSVAEFALARSGETAVRPPSTDPVQEHLRRGAGLEEIGSYREAEAELVAALAIASPSEASGIMKELQRIHEARKSAESAKSDQESAKHFALGLALETHKHYAQALAAFQRSHASATNSKAQALVEEAINRVLDEKESWWEKYMRAWAWPVIVKFALGLLGIVMLYAFLSFVYGRFDAYGRSRARHSNRIEVAEFDDTTDTGFGKALPAVLHTVYEEYQSRAHRNSSHMGAVLLAYRGREATLPVMGSPKYEEFREITLRLPGLDVSEFLRKLNRLVRQPQYRVGGAIYRLGDEIRSAVRMTRYDGRVNRWDSSLWNGPGSPSRASSVAYDVIAIILGDRNA